MTELMKNTLEAMSRLLCGVWVEYVDPNVEIKRKRIKNVEYDMPNNEILIFLEDGSWVHSDYLVISKDQTNETIIL